MCRIFEICRQFCCAISQKIFNKLYDTGYFPSDWCKSVIIPLFKKSDDSDPDNYRGISLLSIVSKVFTGILNKRLYAWAENEEKIGKEQAGFCKGYSTIQLLPGHDEIFSLLFADDIVLVSPSGLQYQINSPKKASKSLVLTVNLGKTKVMVFRKGGHISASEKSFLYRKEIETVNRYKYMGYTLTTKLSSVCACEDLASKAKGFFLRLDEDNVVSRKFRHHCIPSAF